MAGEHATTRTPATSPQQLLPYPSCGGGAGDGCCGAVTYKAAAAQAMAAVELARAMAKQTQNEVATQQAKENRKKLSKTAAAENPVNV
eukprot:CAMPEP_0173122770 /NCGR_PEP_ID=MMETSP1102-20130122/54425_1 /TAXON_ID=49646 /ORGANISM="Geminigera sp., Strain Caron Lab Isolate" /LENGTH=87 /DNA_ID=CAMNT_0014030323 /DNA_START=20 /DNA_END=283 /DNA_ORIENTATION=-